MYAIRCTAPLLRRLARLTPPGKGREPHATTVLGDWYANPLNIGRHRLILCTSAQSLLSVVVPAKDLLGLPQRLAESLAFLLSRLAVPTKCINAELAEMSLVRFGPTRSRSVLGSMNDFAWTARAYFQSDRPTIYLDQLDFRLSETPCGPLNYESPAEVALRLLQSAA